jgi:hypothetical protein
MLASVGVAEVARLALPVLVGGALLVSATPRSWAARRVPNEAERPFDTVT